MNATKFLHTHLLQSPLSTPLFKTSPPSQPHFPRSFPTLSPIRSSSSGGGNGQSRNDSESRLQSPPKTVEIKFRRGSRKRRKQEEDENSGEGTVKKVATPKKSWEEMSMSEKAIELYVGEKGFLFWVNKFAYASIFIIIGGWILFRFVGPSFNLYQLDTPLLSPEAVLKG
ncbi:hypothetical protein SOVF_068840 [Spinacia oleracea]|uniref:Transmembrane protein n=1 Tax=Spinacia oleracea TaxID=3562 RepID=A0A9R0IF35_SPIOL|nr:uncharacterized protein LOC110787856 [Spinacia oleracea]KNA18653.1 hypothetical protein SOVF_068840 [Spinacia oleracea]